jgi:hypothetical protein
MDSIFQTLLEEDQICLFVSVADEFPRGNISDLSCEVHKQMTHRDVLSCIKAVDTACIAVKSSAIQRYRPHRRALLGAFKKRGGHGSQRDGALLHAGTLATVCRAHRCVRYHG